MNINHERLVPGAITYWGDVVGDITDQQDLVDYIASHGGGGGDATWGSIQGTLSDQTDLNNELTGIGSIAQAAMNRANDAYSFASNVDSNLSNHIYQNDAAFAEAFSRISALEQNPGVSEQAFTAHVAANNESFNILRGVTQDNSQRIDALENAGFATQQDLTTLEDSLLTEMNEEYTDLQNQIEQASETAVWGGIAGTITDQSDLMDEFNQDRGRLDDLENGTVVPTGTATEAWVQEQGYLTQHQDLTGYATESWVTSQGYITSSALSGYATESYVQNQGYITSSALSGYATEQWVWDQNYIQFPGDGYDVAWTHDVTVDPDYEGKADDFPIGKFYDFTMNQEVFGEVLDNGDSLSFSGFFWDRGIQKLGLFKVEGVEEDPENAPGEITYEQTFIPFVAAEEPDTSTNATYVLKATVQDGEVTYEWVPEV